MSCRWEWLLELCKEHGWETGAELGVKEGRTTTYLAHAGIAMLAVDLWEDQKDLAQGAKPYKDWDHEKYLTNFSDAVKGKDVAIIRDDTVMASRLVKDESLDFVFIDSTHTYDHVKQEIIHWLPKVKKGGALTGHDYNWEGVKKAVDEAFDDITEFEEDHCWLAWK